LSSPVFTPAITPPLLLARPTPSRAWERDQNPRQRLPLSHSAAVTGFAFADLFNALSRAARCLPQPRSEQQRQGDGQRFFKKAMKSPMFMREATAPASVRPSSVFKMGNFFWKGIL
jgi:hypothetical protein